MVGAQCFLAFDDLFVAKESRVTRQSVTSAAKRLFKFRKVSSKAAERHLLLNWCLREFC